MTGKDVNKVQNEVKKASEKTLTGAVKTWCQLFKSGKEVNEILKENEIKVDKSYYSDIGRKGFFVPIFYKMIAYVYILLTHKSVEAANFKP